MRIENHEKKREKFRQSRTSDQTAGLFASFCNLFLSNKEKVDRFAKQNMKERKADQTIGFF
jgi:hypothetical protein